MHFLLLILIAPFAFLLALMILAVLMLISSVALEFPLLLLAALGFGLLGHAFPKIIGKAGVPCQQM